MMLGETILVIDADKETTQQMVTTLEAKDYLVFTAATKDVGVTMAKKVNPSLIFINSTIAGSSGLEICKALRTIDSLRNIPIVMLSALEGSVDSRYAATYGIVGTLKKPFTNEELVSKTKSILSIKSVAVPDVQEDIESGEIEEAVAVEEEMFEVQEEKTEVPVADKTVAEAIEKVSLPDRAPEEEIAAMEEKKEVKHLQIPDEEPEKIITETEKTYTFKRPVRRKGMRNSLVVPIIIVAAVFILAGTGFVLYEKGMLPWIGKKVQKPVETRPAPQQTTQVPPHEQPKPQQPVPEATPPPPVPSAKPLPAPAAKPAHAPAAKPAPEAKPAAKAMYSVQIGAFKNESNAAALTKQLKDKGYDAFTHKAVKGNETIYKVLAGRYENRKDALKLAETISAKEKTKTIVIHE